MNKYKITPSVNYAAFTDFIYEKIKSSDVYDWEEQHRSCKLASKVLDESSEVYEEINSIWKVAVNEISNEYIKEFTELLNLKEDYYIIFTD